MPRTTIVIVGASFAGLQTAHGLLKGLSQQVKVVLINPSSKWYFGIASPRIIAKPDSFKPEQYLIPIKPGFAKYPKGSFELTIGTATMIDPSQKIVTVSGSTTLSISYDYLVIASGSSPRSLREGTFIPFKPTVGEDEASIASAIRVASTTISSAKTIVIGGAGPIGVEFAGELAEAWAKETGRSITLISATKHLLPMLKDAAGVEAENLLAKQNVTVITSQRVVNAVQTTPSDRTKSQWTVSLDNGKELTADVYVSTTGVVPNNQFIPGEFLSADGWVTIDEHFRVVEKGQGRSKGHEGMYAVGDITTQPVRTAMKVAEQIPVVVANLKADIIGYGKHPVYKPSRSIMMIVPVGASTGTGQMMGWKPWGKMVSFVKGKDFFVSKAPGMVGLA